MAEGAARVAARTAALKAAARDAAATEAEIRALLTDDDARRLEAQRALVEVALGRRAGAEEVAAFYLLVNSAGHDLASEHLGWSTSAWRRWLGATLTRLLLDDPVPAGHPPPIVRGRRPGAPARPVGEDGTRVIHHSFGDGVNAGSGPKAEPGHVVVADAVPGAVERAGCRAGSARR